ncbi:YggT family protein [Ornithinimicrobium humiphilum]|uniref:YggT family protein n=1 Tax=Ornithinimicrobium humiphilum TaxID=125288 RepID=A0A543KMW9_9MICO|nr:YggT family protein [Ornithinimicrobium humiphilum]TQM96433.1 YggT family protein [Ornithinimicrobium humiphilum]
MVGQILSLLLSFYMFVLIGRLVFDWVQVFARDWRPKGPVLVLANAIYALTDPPLRALRKVIPPLRLGGIALDLGFLVLIIAVSMGRSLVLALPF